MWEGWSGGIGAFIIVYPACPLICVCAMKFMSPRIKLFILLNCPILVAKYVDGLRRATDRIWPSARSCRTCERIPCIIKDMAEGEADNRFGLDLQRSMEDHASLLLRWIKIESEDGVLPTWNKNESDWVYGMCRNVRIWWWGEKSAIYRCASLIRNKLCRLRRLMVVNTQSGLLELTSKLFRLEELLLIYISVRDSGTQNGRSRT